MFESAEIGHRLGKAEFKREEPGLRQALLAAQYALLEKARFPVIVLVNGVAGAGKGETVNLLNEWMDPRHIQTHAFGPLSDDERDRPEMWRFWRALPPKGRIGIHFGSWYTDPIVSRVMGHEKRAAYAERLKRIRQFERMLAAEGAVVLKLWLHLSKDAQRKRFRKLAEDKRTAWRVTQYDWAHHEKYEKFLDVCEDALRETSIGEAPWHIVDGSNHEYRSIAVGQLLLDTIRHRLKGKAPAVAPPAPPPEAPLDGRDVLGSLDYAARLSRKRYERRLEDAQAHLAALTRRKAMRERSLVAVFEGMDAAGKGSTIRRLTRALDARFYRVIPVAAPTEEERAQPYLWRFWRHVPRHGHAVIFDRSWYGRVLVERVEGFCKEGDWMRAYHEINDFESQLGEAGAVVCKFWLAVTPEEQLRRFKEREKTPHKRFKITEEDWRNRKKWPSYERAICDMVDRTSTDEAPWHLVPANDKLSARVQVIETLCAQLEARL